MPCSNFKLYLVAFARVGSEALGEDGGSKVISTSFHKRVAFHSLAFFHEYLPVWDFHIGVLRMHT